ncbi:MAG: signal peptide peptidase SppA [Candidatus Margulisiibacteriota bacterium]|jgi:protease-4
MKKFLFLAAIFFFLLSSNQIFSETYYNLNARYLIGSSGALRSGLYGFINPAVATYQYLPEGTVVFQNENTNFGSKALFFGFNGFGSAIYSDDNATNYQITGAFGSRIFSLGLGIGYSAGYNLNQNYSTYFLAGLLYRPINYFSVGFSGKIKTQGTTPEAILDLAYRPLGNDNLTIFADYAFEPNKNLDKNSGSAGVIWEAIEGFRIMGRYFRDQSFNLGLGLSLGTVGLEAKLDQKGSNSRGSYFLRIGGYDNTIIPKLDQRYLKLDFAKPITYRPDNFFDKKLYLLQLINIIDNARLDSSIKGIVINYSEIQTPKNQNPSILWEIRNQLQEFRAKGKKVIIYIDYADINKYDFISVADKIVMDPLGKIDLNGVYFSRTYFKGSLEKLGIGFQEFRFFKYKTAYETFSQDKLSESDKEQYQILLNFSYSKIKQDICSSRKISEETFDTFINTKPMFSAKNALDNNLVDKLGRADELTDYINSLEKTRITFITPSDMESNITPYGTEWSEKSKIAVIYVLGICAMDTGINARTLVKDFETAINNPNIKAIVVRVDSPGGDAIASDIINKEIEKAKKVKPVIISQGSVAASGGYWLAMNGTKILSYPNTLTGSIGVISGFFWNKTIGNFLGISRDYLKIGEHADLGQGFILPDRPANESEIKMIKEDITDEYKVFVNKVALARNKSNSEIDMIAQGRVWNGTDAKARGLVDDFGGLESAINAAKELAGISGNEFVEIVELPKVPFINFQSIIKGQFNNVFLNKSLTSFDDYLKFWLNHNGRAMPMCLDYFGSEEIFN